LCTCGGKPLSTQEATEKVLTKYEKTFKDLAEHDTANELLTEGKLAVKSTQEEKVFGGHGENGTSGEEGLRLYPKPPSEECDFIVHNRSLQGVVCFDDQITKSQFKKLITSTRDAELREKVEGMISEIESSIKPLREEYDAEYRLWFVLKLQTPEREKLLKEYENGAKGNRMFSLQERKEALSDVLALLANK
jgi:hypothetical protein